MAMKLTRQCEQKRSLNAVVIAYQLKLSLQEQI